TVLSRPAAHHRAWMAAVVVTAIIAAAPWFIDWFILHELDVWAPSLGAPPDPGGAIGWYRTLVTWTGVRWEPTVTYVGFDLLTVPGLTLLWLVPLLSTIRATAAAFRVRLALTAGLLGGLAVTAVAVGLPFAAKAALPVAVRAFPTGNPTSATVPF